MLKEFAANMDLHLVMSDAVAGHVRGRLPVMTPRQFLDYLTQKYALDWFFDGSTVQVSAASEAVTKLIRLNIDSYQAWRDQLTTSGVIETKFPMRQGPAADLALVSGPPSYLALLQQWSDAMPRPPQQSAQARPQATVVVFRGSAAATVAVP